MLNNLVTSARIRALCISFLSRGRREIQRVLFLTAKQRFVPLIGKLMGFKGGGDFFLTVKFWGLEFIGSLPIFAVGLLPLIPRT